MTIQEIEQRLEVMEQVAKAYGIFKEEVEQLQKALAELKESKKEGKWKPKNKEWYWYISPFGSVAQTCWHDSKSECDEYIYSHQPIFKTEKECERYKHFTDTVKEKSYEFSKEDFENEDSQKWFIAYDYHSKRFYPDNYLATKMFGVVNFKTYKDAQYIIDNFKEELMEYFV